MRRVKSIIIISFFFITISSKAIDPHFSQFYASALSLNPALTGLSYGNLRLFTNMRNQWSGTTPFQVYSVSADMTIWQNNGSYDFGGIGLYLQNNSTGTGYNDQNAMFSFAYHKALNKKHTQYIAMGFQGGIKQLSIGDLTAKTTQSQWLQSSGYDGNLSNQLNTTKVSIFNPDFQAGVFWYSFVGKSSTAFAGATVFHVSSPNESINGNGGKLGRRIVLHGGSKIKYSKKMAVVPNFVFMTQDRVWEVNLGTAVEYDITKFVKSLSKNPFHRTKPNSQVLSLGTWYRTSDAFILAMGLKYLDFKFGFSYDLNVSKFSAISKGNGGFEISLTYDIKKYKTKTTRLSSSPCPKI